jgi:hypothetical protein
MSSSFDFSKNKTSAKLQQNQSSNKSAVGELAFDDQRSDSVAQLKLQEKANQSNNVAQFLELENQVHNSQQVSQLMALQGVAKPKSEKEEGLSSYKAMFHWSVNVFGQPAWLARLSGQIQPQPTPEKAVEHLFAIMMSTAAGGAEFPSGLSVNKVKGIKENEQFQRLEYADANGRVHSIEITGN